MRNRSVLLLFILLIIALVIVSGKILGPLNAGGASARIFASSSLLITTSPTTSASISSSSPISQGNISDIIGPIFGLIGVIISAVGGIIGAMITKGYFRRRKKDSVTKVPVADELPKTNDEYIQFYRGRLLKDPYFTILQILTMKRPLNVTDMYVPLRLSSDGRSIDELALEAKYDPTGSPQINHRRLGNRSQSGMEPEKAISDCHNKCCIIVGDPGSGKTTLLKYLAVKSTKRELSELPDLPVYIELNAFASSGMSDLLDFASSKWEETYHIPKERALSCIKENLKVGNVLLLLDGLNEAVTGETPEDIERSYERVTVAIRQLGTESPIVVTARKADYSERPPLKGFTKVDVLDFRPEDIREFVNRWFADHPNPQRREDARELNDILGRNSRIQALARNPLLLAVIAIVYEEDLYLPQDRANLYNRCVEILLTKWNAERNIYRPKQFKVESKTHLLGDIAWYFHYHGQRFFPKEELLKVIAEFLPAVGMEEEQNRDILKAIAIENGLLKEQAQEWYGFLHMTIQEYFVAQRIRDDQNKIDVLLEYCDEPWWEEVLLLFAVYTNDASSLLQKLLERGSKSGIQEDIFHTNLILAGHCIATHPTIRRASLREEIISRLFDVLISTHYSLTRQRVIEVLAEIGGTKVNMRLLSLLSNEDIYRDIRISVAVAVSKVGDQSLGRELLQILSNPDIDKDIRKHIANTLGKLGERSLVDSLLAVLQKSDTDDEVRESIADALGTLGAAGKLEEESNIFSELVRLLSNKQISAHVRGRIACSLGKIGKRSLAPQLLEKLSERTIDVYVRMHVADALGILGEVSVVHNLLRLLNDQLTDQGIRMSIVDALGLLGERSVIRQLKEILFDHNDNPDVRGHAAIALGILGDRSIIPGSLDLLSNSGTDSFIRQSIVIALGKLAECLPAHDLSQQISTPLMELLSNRHIETMVRMRIADILGSLGDRKLASNLLNILLDSSVESQVREAIVDALGRLGEQAIASDLRKLLFNPGVELNIRGHIAYVLALLRDASAFPMLVRLLTEERLDSHIRWLIADSLGVLGEHVQTSILIPLLSREEVDKNVRKHIADVLAQLIDDEEEVRELAELLPSSDIADSIYRTLWVISHKIRLRIAISSPDKQPEIVRWRTEFEI